MQHDVKLVPTRNHILTYREHTKRYEGSPPRMVSARWDKSRTIVTFSILKESKADLRSTSEYTRSGQACVTMISPTVVEESREYRKKANNS